MKHIVLHGTKRVPVKKSETKALRRAGNIPCVLYGQDVKDILFTVTEKELKTITHTPETFIVDLDIEGDKYTAILHDAQYHPVSDKPLHYDFLYVSEDKPISIDIPLSITGSSIGIKMGGRLMKGVRKIRVSGLMDKLPEFLPVDITKLKIGDFILAENLAYDNLTILSAKTTLVCAVKSQRAAVAVAEITETAAETTEEAKAE